MLNLKDSSKVFLNVFTLFLLFGASMVYGKDESGSLTVNIEGLTSNKGVVRIALFNSEQAFSSQEYGINGAVKYDSLEIKDRKSVWKVEKLPFGTYAIRTFHDEDSSGKFKVNRIGIPQYEYGFSNDAKALFGPPSYKKAKFEFKTSKSIKITMHR